MNPKESDPSGAFSGGGAAGLEPTDGQRSGSDGSRQTDGQPNSGNPPAEDGRHATGSTTEADQAERDVVTSGTAATSEIADPEAQRIAEQQGDGTPLPR
jgi:hypothetical protein